MDDGNNRGLECRLTQPLFYEELSYTYGLEI